MSVMALSELMPIYRVPRSPVARCAYRTSGACASAAFAAGVPVTRTATTPMAAEAA
ncbi:hypothetical protein ACFZDI_21865 [Streptomyces sp. NPDC007907]|uniref:hypothetical protein n=1 Tax=Streptomyces sp. NPDC007907 TaxID=3364789 RepID=UPI0036F07FAF